MCLCLCVWCSSCRYELSTDDIETHTEVDVMFMNSYFYIEIIYRKILTYFECSIMFIIMIMKVDIYTTLPLKLDIQVLHVVIN